MDAFFNNTNELISNANEIMTENRQDLSRGDSIDEKTLSLN